MSDLFDTKIGENLDLDLKPDVNPHFKNAINGLDFEISISDSLNRANKILQTEKELGNPRNPFSEVNSKFLQSVLPVNPDKLSPELKDATAEVLTAYVIDGRSPLESIGILTEKGGLQNNISNFHAQELNELARINNDILDQMTFYFGPEIISIAKDKMWDKINELFQTDRKLNELAQENLIEFSNSIGSIEGIRETFPKLFFNKVEDIFERAQTRTQADMIINILMDSYKIAENVIQMNFDNTKVDFKDRNEQTEILPSMLTMSKKLDEILEKYSDFRDKPAYDEAEALFVGNELKSFQNFNFLKPNKD